MGGAAQTDYLAVVEAAYASRGTLEEWLAGIAEACLIFDEGLGIVAYTYDASDAARFRPGPIVSAGPVGSPERIQSMIRLEGAAAIPPSLVRVLYDPSPPTILVSDVMGPAFEGSGIAEQLRELGMADVIGIRSADPSQRGVLLAISRPSRKPLAQRRRAAMDRIAAHNPAGYRMRIHAAPREADAIYDERGQLAHATEPGASAQTVLSHALDQMRRARHALRRVDPDAALAIWEGLVDGTWSLVDHVDRDGKRFVLARRNEPHVRDVRALTLREQQVAAYAALGHSQKLIAYELGLPKSTVSGCLSRAMRKLGIRDRLELQALFGPGVGE